MTPQELAAQLASSIDTPEVVRLAQTLVRMDSVAAPNRPHEEAVALFLAGRLRASGLRVTTHELAPQRINVMAEWRGAQPGKLLLLEGHSDVVTEGERGQWHKDPFSGEIENGKLHGRGSCDMKGGLAAAVVLLETLAKHNPSLPGTVRLLIPCDEEGMMLGIKDMVRQGWQQKESGQPADGAIVCEPEELELCLHQRGGIRVALRFVGVQAHGAMPYAGKNPIPTLARFVTWLGMWQHQLQTRVGEHPMLGTVWVTPTVLEAGSIPQLNVMHAEALLALDIRTVPGVEHAEVHATLQKTLEQFCTEDGIAGQYQTIDDRPWTATDPNASIVRALEDATRQTFRREPKYGGVPGTTDGTFLHQAGVPIVTIGPGDRHVPHQANEWVSIEELQAAARLYASATVLFLSEV